YLRDTTLGPCEYTVENYARAIHMVYDSWVKRGSYSKVAKLYGISTYTVRFLVNLATSKTDELLKGFSGLIKPRQLEKITGSSAITIENEKKASQIVYDSWREHGAIPELATLHGISQDTVLALLNLAMSKTGGLQKGFPHRIKPTAVAIRPIYAKITGISEFTKENEEKAIKKVYEAYLEHGSFKEVGRRLGVRA
ncbi:MAG: hypothetical protein KAW52_08675, partial [candidate division Zixibacteria bacterium]|nr:hypothetical protein [candidate division Zixibacteria bacterium]